MQLFPAGTGAARRQCMHLRRCIVLDEKHAKQNQMRGLDVEYIRIEGMRAQALGKPEKFRVDVARKLEARSRERRQQPEQLNIGFTKANELFRKILARLRHEAISLNWNARRMRARRTSVRLFGSDSSW